MRLWSSSAALLLAGFAPALAYRAAPSTLLDTSRSRHRCSAIACWLLRLLACCRLTLLSFRGYLPSLVDAFWFRLSRGLPSPAGSAPALRSRFRLPCRPPALHQSTSHRNPCTIAICHHLWLLWLWLLACCRRTPSVTVDRATFLRSSTGSRAVYRPQATFSQLPCRPLALHHLCIISLPPPAGCCGCLPAVAAPSSVMKHRRATFFRPSSFALVALARSTFRRLGRRLRPFPTSGPPPPSVHHRCLRPWLLCGCLPAVAAPPFSYDGRAITKRLSWFRFSREQAPAPLSAPAFASLASLWPSVTCHASSLPVGCCGCLPAVAAPPLPVTVDGGPGNLPSRVDASWFRLSRGLPPPAGSGPALRSRPHSHCPLPPLASL
jgi:hypothetical protein